MEELARRHPDVAFFVVYTREPHAGEGAFRGVAQPKTLDERMALARRLQDEGHVGRTILVDEMGSPVQQTYGGLPNMLYLIDPEGRVAAKWDWADADGLAAKLAARAPE